MRSPYYDFDKHVVSRFSAQQYALWCELASLFAKFQRGGMRAPEQREVAIAAVQFIDIQKPNKPINDN